MNNENFEAQYPTQIKVSPPIDTHTSQSFSRSFFGKYPDAIKFRHRPPGTT